MAGNKISRRAKANMPTVLLTLLSIVQALALELMWGHLSEQPYLYTFSFLAVLGWAQLFSTLLGILLIWLIYSGLVMRFTWVPTSTDAIFPFIVGIAEFAQISALGHQNIGIWFALMGFLFGAMTWVSQFTMKRARLDRDNAEFFDNVSPATNKDHVKSLVPMVGLMLVGFMLWLTQHQGWLALLGVAIVIVMLTWQLWMQHHFTNRSYESQ